MKSLKLQFLVLLIFIGSVIPAHGHAQSPVSYMYRNDNRNIPVTRFSPGDTIGLLVIFKDLQAGDYTFHADWYNAAGQLQETSRSRFTKKAGRLEIIDAKLEIIKASPLRRLFSSVDATGYQMKFYGKWHVKLYLNGKSIRNKVFTVK